MECMIIMIINVNYENFTVHVNMNRSHFDPPAASGILMVNGGNQSIPYTTDRIPTGYH